MLADLYEQFDLKIKKERKKLPWSSRSEFKDELNSARQANFSVYRNPYDHYKSMLELTPIPIRMKNTQVTQSTQLNLHLSDVNTFQDAQDNMLNNPPDFTHHDSGNRKADYNESLGLIESMISKRQMEAGLIHSFSQDQMVTGLDNFYKSRLDTRINRAQLKSMNKSLLAERAIEKENLNVTDMIYHRDHTPTPPPTY